MTAPEATSGIYALFDLGGAPLDPADLATLGLEVPVGASVAAGALDGITPSAARRLVSNGRTTVFLGWLDEPGDVAGRLGLASSTPEPVLARAALDRFGARAPDELLGEWSMLDHAPGGPVTMLVGHGGRMPLLYARVRDRVAVAPSIHVLSRLPWIGRDLDEDAFLLSMTICAPDDERRQRTILRGVRAVPRGCCVRVTRTGGPLVSVVDPFVAVPRWAGSRRDAMIEAEELLRRVVRERLSKSPAPGLLLSGGLDSSLIAWTLAAEGAPALPALSSAAAPGRGVVDETRFAALVADALELPLHRVAPPVDVNVYRPSAGTLEASNAPPLSPRDYLYAAFAETAGALSVTELFDGAHGELTFTALMPVRSWRDRPRAVARSARDALRARLRPRPDPIAAALHVVLAPHCRARPPRAVIDAVASEVDERCERDVDEPWGYSAGARPPLRRDVTEMRTGRLRLIRPFHDLRLLRLFAGFPARFMVGDGMTRWPARAILKGRLPEEIVRRRVGMPFSPDYHLRLAEQAPAALARLPAFRASGCDEWFDLAWLEDRLTGFIATAVPDSEDTLRVQLTAHACEFLTWWRNG